MKERYTVEVLPETQGKPSRYTVECDSPDDALLLAFALDGGWGWFEAEDNDASEMLPLAKSYCAVVSVQPVVK